MAQYPGGATGYPVQGDPPPPYYPGSYPAQGGLPQQAPAGATPNYPYPPTGGPTNYPPGPQTYPYPQYPATYPPQPPSPAPPSTTYVVGPRSPCPNKIVIKSGLPFLGHRTRLVLEDRQGRCHHRPHGSKTVIRDGRDKIVIKERGDKVIVKEKHKRGGWW
ncbi:uncharacterized protein LOC143289066 [Babylonia areolata]|uniref:uncharacterized protein LOC143289066 n=1 Tax=Babylonia areolata TaxID=304850 RepID=UPI003FD5FD09